MNRRSFLKLFAAAAPVAAVAPTYFFAPKGGWRPDAPMELAGLVNRSYRELQSSDPSLWGLRYYQMVQPMEYMGLERSACVMRTEEISIEEAYKVPLDNLRVEAVPLFRNGFRRKKGAHLWTPSKAAKRLV